MTDAGAIRRILGCLMAAALVAAAGCSSARTRDGPDMAVTLAETLEREARELPESERRERLVRGLQRIRDLLAPKAEIKPVEVGEARPEPPQAPPDVAAGMFRPTNLVIGYFTRARDFDDNGRPDGLEVRVQPVDRFGDPTKAVGSYRIEVFEYRRRTLEHRGGRLGHWFVEVLTPEANRKYYDPIDRSYVFPLSWQRPIASGTDVIVQATYYPVGPGEKKMAQRVIRIGGE